MCLRLGVACRREASEGIYALLRVREVRDLQEINVPGESRVDQEKGCAQGVRVASVLA